MRRTLLALGLLLAVAGSSQAHGLLIPEEKSLPPLAMLNHQVTIAIDDQVAVTRVEQTFRNHTDRPLEATYLFPVPKGASVNQFTMWVGGTEVKGEMLDAAKARQIYTEIVRRTQDPGLLEYMGNDLLNPRGTPNVAVVAGTIETRPWAGGGITIFLHGDDGNTYVYMHLLQIEGAIPRRVAQGDLIGLTGATGHAFGYHTHFEFHPRGGDAVSPYALLSAACR